MGNRRNKKTSWKQMKMTAQYIKAYGIQQKQYNEGILWWSSPKTKNWKGIKWTLNNAPQGSRKTKPHTKLIGWKT